MNEIKAMMMEDKEIFVPLADFPAYDISQYGRVRSWNYRRVNGEQLLLSAPRILKQQNSTNGYIVVMIHQKPRRISRLLGLTFIPNPDNKPCVDHIDRNKHNNSLDNLRWVTKSENALNTNLFSHNTSGVKGVYYSSDHSLWVAQIQINGKRVIKYSKTMEEAIENRHRMDKGEDEAV